MPATTTAETFERHDCRACGIWVCGNCGWRRGQASRFSKEPQQCSKCAGTEGIWLPIRHIRWSARHDHDLWAVEQEREGKKPHGL